MKAIIFYTLTGLVLASVEASAQECASHLMLQNNKTITLGTFTKRGDVNGSIILKTSNVSNNGGVVTATVKTEAYDKRKKLLHTTNNTVRCQNGVLMMDMRLYLPQQQTEQFNKAGAQANSVYLEYPANIQTGQQLKDGRFEISLDNNGLKQKLDMIIGNRTVVDEELLTTPAGTWKCWVITYNAKINVQTGPIGIPLNFEAKEWYTPELGVVKSENKTGYSQVISIK